MGSKRKKQMAKEAKVETKQEEKKVEIPRGKFADRVEHLDATKKGELISMIQFALNQEGKNTNYQIMSTIASAFVQVCSGINSDITTRQDKLSKDFHIVKSIWLDVTRNTESKLSGIAVQLDTGV